MLSDSNQQDRREHQRFIVKDLAIAVTKKQDSQIGKILNISSGGMAVQYFDRDVWLADAEYIDIIYERKYFIRNIPVQNINDFMVEDQGKSNRFRERQCCLKFGLLSNEQEKLLGEFIQNQRL
jgi:hypothetical protein